MNRRVKAPTAPPNGSVHDMAMTALLKASAPLTAQELVQRLDLDGLRTTVAEVGHALAGLMLTNMAQRVDIEGSAWPHYEPRWNVAGRPDGR